VQSDAPVIREAVKVHGRRQRSPQRALLALHPRHELLLHLVVIIGCTHRQDTHTQREMERERERERDGEVRLGHSPHSNSITLRGTAEARYESRSVSEHTHTHTVSHAKWNE
jgi:hypothetical protein